jgi:hypothetical protein
MGRKLAGLLDGGGHKKDPPSAEDRPVGFATRLPDTQGDQIQVSAHCHPALFGVHPWTMCRLHSQVETPFPSPRYTLPRETALGLLDLGPASEYDRAGDPVVDEASTRVREQQQEVDGEEEHADAPEG